MALRFGLLFVAAYLFGSIPLAYLVARWTRGIDLRRYGSGQVGASNLARSVSRPWGVIVGLYDLGKGAMFVWFARLLGLDLALQIAIGTAVVAGHNWPVFLRFNAGRGLATTVGVSLFVFPWGIIPFLVCALFTFVVGSSPLPVLIAVASLPLTSWLMRYFGHPQPLTLTLGLLVLFVILVIRRLTAPRTVASSQVRTRELLLNRFLFDRDLRDGQAWIRRKPEEVVNK